MKRIELRNQSSKYLDLVSPPFFLHSPSLYSTGNEINVSEFVGGYSTVELGSSTFYSSFMERWASYLLELSAIIEVKFGSVNLRLLSL